MPYLILILQIVIAAGILNVWIIRFKKGTPYRGKSAQSMPEEFAAYGLPGWFMWVVGVLKVGSALALIVGIWWAPAVIPAALVLAVLMVGALLMHLKVGDPLSKSLPAFTVLTLTVVLALLQSAAQ